MTDLRAQFGWLLSDETMEIGTRIVFAILLFLGGWILSKLFSYLVYRILCATDIDNRLAKKLGIDLIVGQKKGEENALERFLAKTVHYVLMLLVVVGVLQYAGLTQVAGPIQRFVDTVIQALPYIGKAALILVAAYFGGTILKVAVTTFLNRVGIDRRFAELADAKPEGEDKAPQQPFSQAAGRVVFWLIMVLGLAGAFEALEIGPIADPLRNAIDRVITLFPSLALAALLIAGGYVLGRIVRAIVRNLLQSMGFDALVARLKLDRLTGKTSPSDVVGIVFLVFVVFQAIIAAFNELGLATLSEPLTAMMAQFWTILPALAVSTLIVVFGFVVGRLLRTVVAATFHNIGADEFMEKLGFGKLAERKDRLGEYSQLAGFVTQVAVVLIAVAQALQNLDLHTWAVYVTSFLVYCVQHVAVALVIVIIGFAVGNYVRDLVNAHRSEKNDDLPAWIGEFVRYTVLVFAFTMAVHQLNVAENFVLISFSMLFGSLCLALALAFGLGARDVAGEIVKRRWLKARARLGDEPWPPGGSAAIPPVAPPKVPPTQPPPPSSGGDKP